MRRTLSIKKALPHGTEGLGPAPCLAHAYTRYPLRPDSPRSGRGIREREANSGCMAA